MIIKKKKMSVLTVCFFILISCGSSKIQYKIKTDVNKKDPFFYEIKVDSLCIEKLIKFIESKYNFKPNDYIAERTKKDKISIIFGYKHPIVPDEPYPIDDRIVHIIINENCEIDSVISSMEEIDKSNK